MRVCRVSYILQPLSIDCFRFWALAILARPFSSGSSLFQVTDRNGVEGARQGIDENMRFIRRCAHEQNPLLSAAFGLHASFTVSEETLAATAASVYRLDPLASPPHPPLT